MGYFIHSPDDNINISGLVVPLSWFITQESLYTLSAPYVSREYFQANYPETGDSAKHVLFTRYGQDSGSVPYIDGDNYISNKLAYEAAYNAYLAAQELPQTLEGAKTYQINLAATYFGEIVKTAGVVYAGIIFNSAPDLYARWKNEHDYALRNSVLLTGHYLKDIFNNEITLLSVAQLTEIIDLMDEFFWAAQQVYDNHVDAINALGTIGAVLAYDYTTNWSVTPYDKGLTFFASYATSIDADYAGGAATGTATGGAAVLNGYLDLAHGDTRYVSYDGTSNVDSAQVGTIYLEKFKPNYSGTPATDQVIFSIAKADADSTNLIELAHKATTGNLESTIKDSSDVLIATINFGVWSPVSGTDYFILAHYDITTGDTYIKINGVQFGSTDTSTGTRDANIDLLRIGSGYNSGSPVASNFSIGRLHVSSL